MSTYLVTGGAGFIGSHLCETLVARGDTVRVLDDLSTGHRRNLPRNVIFIEGDVADPAIVARAIDGTDGCFHLAAIASVEKGVNDWLGTHRANIPARSPCLMPSGAWAAEFPLSTHLPRRFMETRPAYQSPKPSHAATVGLWRRQI